MIRDSIVSVSSSQKTSDTHHKKITETAPSQENLARVIAEQKQTAAQLLLLSARAAGSLDLNGLDHFSTAISVLPSSEKLDIERQLAALVNDGSIALDLELE